MLNSCSRRFGGHCTHHWRELPQVSFLSRQNTSSVSTKGCLSRQNVFVFSTNIFLSRPIMRSVCRNMCLSRKNDTCGASINDTPTAVSRTSTSNAVLTVTLRPRCVTHGRVPARVSVMYMIMIGDYQSFPPRAVCSVAVTSHPHTSRAQAAASRRK